MRINNMLKVMKKSRFPEDVIYHFEHIYNNYEGDELIFMFINEMDKHMTEKQRFLLWEQNGSCKLTHHDKARRAFALEHADKPLTERVKIFTKTFNPLKIYTRYWTLGDEICLKDNILTVILVNKNNGVHTGKYTCGCPFIRKLNQPFTLSPTYCGCAAGGRLYAYQLIFGVKMKIKSIDTVLSSNGERPCSFTYEII